MFGSGLCGLTGRLVAQEGGVEHLLVGGGKQGIGIGAEDQLVVCGFGIAARRRGPGKARGGVPEFGTRGALNLPACGAERIGAKLIARLAIWAGDDHARGTERVERKIEVPTVSGPG